jgi:hypothetical protein
MKVQKITKPLFILITLYFLVSFCTDENKSKNSLYPPQITKNIRKPGYFHIQVVDRYSVMDLARNYSRLISFQ